MTPLANSSTHMDTVVVGAGITGLRTARCLVDAGQSVRVLESRDRVGGRLVAVEDGPEGSALDLGATWFWPNESRIQGLVAELGVATHGQHRAGHALYDDPRGVQRLPGNPLDVESGRFTTGAASLARALADTLPSGTVLLGTPVQDVAVAGDRVRVTAEGAEFSARQVVLALPPALAVHHIRFDPGLPDALTSLAAQTPVWMGGTAKVVIRYPRPFWREAGLAGAAVSHRGPLREIHDMSGPGGQPPALFGFAAPPTDLEPGSPQAGPVLPGGLADLTEEEIVRQLVRLFGEEAATPDAIHILDWSRERWTSPPGATALQRYELYGHPLYHEPVQGRVHLASTETAPAFAGHIEGALLAAELVAERILGSHS